MQQLRQDYATNFTTEAAQLAVPRNWVWLLAKWFMADRLRWWLWLPVAMGVGIAFYFALPVEPALDQLSGPLATMAALALALIIWHRRKRAPLALFAMVMLFGVILGFAACQWRALQVAAPAIAYQGSFMVEGRVLLAEPRGEKQRVTLTDLDITDLEPEVTPYKVRVTLRANEPPVQAGDRIVVKARLQPPGGPLLPGGFDYARQAWFDQLGGLGYAIGSMTLIERGGAQGWQVAVNGLRQRIADAAVASIDGPAAAVAAALLTALRAGISEEVWRAMQLSGLAHLLAISGLHMGLVAGTVFLAVRYGIALYPPLVLRWPAKKYAAIAALAVALFYLLMAGMTVPTTRAFIMTGVALLAVIADRNPFSMRLVALAAFFILLFRPEALLGASFQMSFAAVIGLIAFYESRPFAAKPMDTQSDGGIEGWRLIKVYFIGVAVTTLIASLATSPLGAYHFQRVAAYGIVANLVGVPLTAFWIMPTGLLALAAMPFGLSAPFFWLMGVGIDLLLQVAHIMAELPGSGLNAGQLPLSALIAFVLGGLWLCLWRASWRWFGVLIWLAIIPIMLVHRPPDIVIERGGGLVALRNPSGHFDLIRWRNDKFTIQAWERALGGNAFGDWPEIGKGRQGAYACDPAGCTAKIGDRLIAIARTPAAAVEDCRRADLVIATRAVDSCHGDGRGELVGSRELWLSQGMALWFKPNGTARRMVADERGERPWVR